MCIFPDEKGIPVLYEFARDTKCDPLALQLLDVGIELRSSVNVLTRVSSTDMNGSKWICASGHSASHGFSGLRRIPRSLSQHH